jgi:hypothetical protein
MADTSGNFMRGAASTARRISSANMARPSGQKTRRRGATRTGIAPQSRENGGSPLVRNGDFGKNQSAKI